MRPGSHNYLAGGLAGIIVTHFGGPVRAIVTLIAGTIFMEMLMRRKDEGPTQCHPYPRKTC